MDGSSHGGDSFEKSADVFQAATHTMKTAFTPLGGNASSSSISDTTSSHSNGNQSVTMVQPEFGDVGKKAEEDRIEKLRVEAHQTLHTNAYFYPVFQAKPRQIEQEREQSYKASNEQDEQEKKQEEIMKSKQEDNVFDRQQRVRREGEGMKIGG